MLPILVLGLLADPAAAADMSGGGLTVATANPNGDFGPNLDAGQMGCVGGLGYSLEDHLRLGGEGQGCWNRQGYQVFLGPQVGAQAGLLGLQLSARIGAGGGWLDMADTDARLRAGFVYARPSLGVGIPMKFMAVEASVFAMLPVPVVQSLGGVMEPRVVLPTTGVELSVLFGDFSKRKKRPQPVASRPPPPPMPASPPVPTPPPGPARAPVPPPGTRAVTPGPPPPLPPGAIPEEGDGRPLAIPAG